ncbi:MAG: hypothetical protein ACYDA8_19055, partial [Deferrisomatales bacterium]
PWGEALAPRYLRFPRGGMILEPWDPEHGRADLVLDPAGLEGAVLPLGEPFSRLWHDGRLWRPVRVPG